MMDLGTANTYDVYKEIYITKH